MCSQERISELPTVGKGLIKELNKHFKALVRFFMVIFNHSYHENNIPRTFYTTLLSPTSSRD